MQVCLITGSNNSSSPEMLLRPNAGEPDPHLPGCLQLAIRSWYADPSFSSWRQVYKAEPEFFNRLHRGKKFSQISRLTHIAIRSHFIAAHNILAQLGGAEDHDRDAAQLRARLHRGQYRQTIFLRQIQVQEDQVGSERVHVFFPAV